MKNRDQIKVIVIDKISPYLKDVVELWRLNRKKLGFFPKGAFEDAARNRCIFVALTPKKECVGYLLFRESSGRIMITHLCVDRQWRDKGVASCLLDHLKGKTKDLRGIGLWCRRDYEENNLWPKQGFVAQGDKPGRHREGKRLTFWWFDHNHPDLFSIGRAQQLESKLHVVLDANVFFDLDGEEKEEFVESKSLLSDWLNDSLELCVTGELFNEIDRNDEPLERKRQRERARSFTRLPCDDISYEASLEKLGCLFPREAISESDKSDVRQLARTIGSGVTFFVTKDGVLLNVEDKVYEQFGVRLIRPADLIVHLDKLRREVDYQPVRFAGTIQDFRLVRSGEEGLLTRSFLNYEKGESKRDFQRRLRRYIAAPDKYGCYLAIGGDGKPIAFIIFGTQADDELEIPVFRVGVGRMAPTIARYLILKTIQLHSDDRRMFTKVTDTSLGKCIVEALREDGFFLVGGAWVKIHLSVAETAKEFSCRLNALASRYPDYSEFFLEPSSILGVEDSIKDVQAMADIEKFFWPAKVIDAEIPTYIVPIQPRWAKDLFDEDLASQTLFGARHDLAFNREGVYYRSKRSFGGRAPGRILWYVSSSDSYCKDKSIRACSRLDEIVIDKPKVLFGHFRRLGVYAWENVLSVAKKDLNSDVMAIRFSDTELFKNPIPWGELQEVLKKDGCNSLIQSPVHIPKHTFANLYAKGAQVE